MEHQPRLGVDHAHWVGDSLAVRQYHNRLVEPDVRGAQRLPVAQIERLLSPCNSCFAERAGSLTVRKINADENPVTTRSYRVMSMPTMMLFRAGQPVAAIVGARPKARLLPSWTPR